MIRDRWAFILGVTAIGGAIPIKGWIDVAALLVGAYLLSDAVGAPSTVIHIHRRESE